MACPPNAGAQMAALADRYPGVGVQRPGYNQQQDQVFTGIINNKPHYQSAGNNPSLMNKALGLLGLGGNSNESSIFTQIVNDISADITANISMQCGIQATVGQHLSVNCGSDFEEGKKPFADNLGCKACREMWSAIPANRANLELEAVKRDPNYDENVASRNQPATLTGNAFILSTQTDFYPCIFACTRCGFYDLSQDATYSWDQSCTSNTELSSTVSSQFEAKVNDYLKNQQDFLGQMGGVFSGPMRNCMSKDIANRVSASFTTDVAQSLIDRMQSTQNMVVAEGSRSVWGNKWNQTLSANSVSTLISQQKIFNNLYSNVEIDAASNLLAKNDTIGDLANAVAGLTKGVGKAFAGLVGRALMIIGILLVGLVVIFIGTMAFSKDARDTMFRPQHAQYGSVR